MKVQKANITNTFHPLLGNAGYLIARDWILCLHLQDPSSESIQMS